MGFSLVGGAGDLLKDGAKHLSGIHEAIMKNIEAVKELAQLTRSSYGPNGMNKLIINHLEKLFVTSDAATILAETDVVHPAAKVVTLAAKAQESECGDNTNFVVVFAGELLAQALNLLKMGLHPSDIVAGYTLCAAEAMKLIKELPVHTVDNLHDRDQVKNVMKSVIMSKQLGVEDFISQLITDACVEVLPKNPKAFNVDNVRVAKILGSGLHTSTVIRGMVFPRGAEGSITSADSCKVAVFGCAIDLGATETKGTVLINTSKELMEFTKGEEDSMEKAIKDIAETGAKVVISGEKITELALHFIDKYGMMALRIPSKFELRRVCRTLGATPCIRLGAPTPEELGYCDKVYVKELGGRNVTVFSQEKEESKVSTIVIRGATENMLDDVERAIDDGVNTYKVMCKEGGQFVPGAGAVEIELATRVSKMADSRPGLEQYAIRKYAEAFEAFPRTLAENAGQNATDAISNLYAAHATGNQCAGIDIESENPWIDAKERQVFDLMATKHEAIRLASESAITVLRVDQIIMAKQAGGPKPPQQGGPGER
eukprot:GFYU01002639.1.p1 GENE.GFYU01002639.1~~GFYU01002639.1.p1  ORF type:complete len:544 (+),score=202.27 GFYU01002639.1:100-1731(+)